MNRFKLILAIGLLAALVPAAANNNSLWHVTMNLQSYGPVEFHLQIEESVDGISGRSLSGATSMLAQLPGDRDVSRGLMAFTAVRADNGSYEGAITAPWEQGAISLTIDGDELKGSIDDGIFAGSFAATRSSDTNPIRNYTTVLDSFDQVVAAKLFAPADLEQPGYKEFRAKLGQLVELATDDLDLLFGFRWLWQNDPFSHFQLKRSAQSAAQVFEMFDNYRVGFDAATVDFVDDIAVLTVKTMMGADTIEQIDNAYERIAAERPSALIIDLRGNGGGAFAVKPLVEHVIDEPLDAGFFISQVWNRQHDSLPSTDAVLATPTWDGWSIIAFWKAVQESDIVRIQFNPVQPNFDGPVYVLLDERSASATELAADAFRSSGITTLIGQRSAGEMLSQSMFDVADGFIVSLPVADYYSVAHGRIEGAGVPVDVEASSAQALEVAKQLARNRSSRPD
jgi:hypothetical protein